MIFRFVNVIFVIFQFLSSSKLGQPKNTCPFMLIEVIDGRIMNHFWHILELDNQLLQNEEGIEILSKLWFNGMNFDKINITFLKNCNNAYFVKTAGVKLALLLD